MRAVSRVAFVAWFVVSAGGCAAITGLDSISEQDCAPNCGDAQGTKDVTVDVPSTGDSTAPDTSTGSDTGIGADTSTDAPGTMDSSKPADGGEAGTKESGADVGVDSPMDAPPDVHEAGVDAPADSGCGPLTST
ncbi:MAG TPA: hypothetical protein VHS09_01765, partial [Polyangiaceae bacterium]|nr:hypothetical protein [Polyangiaceae bacterium]